MYATAPTPWSRPSSRPGTSPPPWPPDHRKKTLMMYGNQQQTGYPQPANYQKKGGGCLKAFLITAVVMIGLVVIAVVAFGSGGRTDDTTATSASAGPTPAERRAPGIGDTVKDGKFSFKVTKVQTGVKHVGDQYLGS